MKSFEEYVDESNKAWEKYRSNFNKATIPQQERDRFYTAFFNYSMVKVTQKLVFVTWVLCIATIIVAVFFK